MFYSKICVSNRFIFILSNIHSCTKTVPWRSPTIMVHMYVLLSDMDYLVTSNNYKMFYMKFDKNTINSSTLCLRTIIFKKTNVLFCCEGKVNNFRKNKFCKHFNNFYKLFVLQTSSKIQVWFDASKMLLVLTNFICRWNFPENVNIRPFIIPKYTYPFYVNSLIIYLFDLLVINTKAYILCTR